MSTSFKKLNLKQYAMRLLTKEHFLSREDKHQLHQSLRALLYELHKLQLQQACVADDGQNAGQCGYTDLEQLICRVHNRIHVLPQEQIG